MRQVVQRPRDGAISVREVPAPALRPGWLLVDNEISLISAGTERGKIEMGGKNLAQKARARPDLVRKVVDRARVEGVRSAVAVARERLDGLAALGYSSAGVVRRLGAGVEGLAPGDRVACAGAGFANHAGTVAVPRNLVARVPAATDPADAAYATVGAIALHGVRQSEAVIGERVGVVGLGLVGQLAVRLLSAAGCEPVGIDMDPEAVALASAHGIPSFTRDYPALEAAVLALSGGLGLDAVLVCAATASTDPLELAARLARDRGRLVVLGDVPVAAERAVLYEKELELRLSRSYGPGRYDRDYEERGRDLPAGYVRWTEQRNLQAFIDLVAAGRVRPSELTTHRFSADEAPRAYGLLAGEEPDRRPFGILLEHGLAEPKRPSPDPPGRRRTRPGRSGRPRVGLVGAGAFARATLIPALIKGGGHLAAVSSEGGLSAADVAARFGFDRTASCAEEVIGADDLDAVVVATRHSSHARLVSDALRSGKSVLVEKPLALTHEELARVEASLAEGGTLMVGFNRRFAPLAEELRAALAEVPQRVLLARVNAGPLAEAHWLHDREDGGGRLLGEGCHFVDLLCHLAGSPAVSAHAFATPQPGRGLECSDNLVGSLRLADGTVATLLYTGGGDARPAKERIEAFGGGLSAVLDDFRRLELYRGGRRTVVKEARNKGHDGEVAAFIAAAAGRIEPLPAAGYLSSTRATLALADSLCTGAAVEVL